MADNGTWGWGDGNGSPANQPLVGQDNNDGYDTWGDAGDISSSEEQSTSQNDAWGSSDGWDNSDGWGQSDNWGAQAFNAGSQPNMSNQGFDQEQGFGQNQGFPQGQNFGQNQCFQQGQDFGQGQGFANTDQMQPPKPNVKLSIPKACIVLAVLCVVIAGFVVVISSIKVKPKTQTQQATQQTQQAQQTTEQTQQTTGTNDVRLLYMAENATIDYSGDIFSTSGVVVGKDRFVDSNQLVYRIRINLAVGTESQTVNFYCTYNTFQSVGVNDPVMVSYQQISNGFISINSITK